MCVSVCLHARRTLWGWWRHHEPYDDHSVSCDTLSGSPVVRTCRKREFVWFLWHLNRLIKETTFSWSSVSPVNVSAFSSPQCSNCDAASAACWCLDCNEALCGVCVSAHRRVTVTRSHRLLHHPPEGKNTPPTPRSRFCWRETALCCQLTVAVDLWLSDELQKDLICCKSVEAHPSVCEPHLWSLWFMNWSLIQMKQDVMVAGAARGASVHYFYLFLKNWQSWVFLTRRVEL